MEFWKEVPGYSGSYLISTLGRVWSNKTERILKPHHDKDGYARVILRKNLRSHGMLIHRMVAKAFIPNSDNLPCVNHKDENPRNNRVENLEWCTYEYNCTYGTVVERRTNNTDYKCVARKNAKRVAQYDANGNLLRVWDSVSDCGRKLGFDISGIARVCRGSQRTAYGFIWKYVANG